MKKKIKIGLFGFGTVGRAVYQVIAQSKNAHADIRKICVRNIDKPRDLSLPTGILTDCAEDVIGNPDINLIVEVVDDANASYRIVTEALRRRIPVVSGSKAMIAEHLPELIELQRRYDTALLYDASSCGSIPVIRNL